jgi:hypothetical protein
MNIVSWRERRTGESHNGAEVVAGTFTKDNGDWLESMLTWSRLQSRRISYSGAIATLPCDLVSAANCYACWSGRELDGLRHGCDSEERGANEGFEKHVEMNE